MRGRGAAGSCWPPGHGRREPQAAHPEGLTDSVGILRDPLAEKQRHRCREAGDTDKKERNPAEGGHSQGEVGGEEDRTRRRLHPLHPVRDGIALVTQEALVVEGRRTRAAPRVVAPAGH